MENLDYLKSIGVTDEDTQQKCLTAMAKYGDNHWWELDGDPRKFAYYQIQEPYMLCEKVSRVRESVSLLLGRPVFTHEFGINSEGLIAEAQRAWTYQVGVTSDKERAERVQQSIQDLHDWSKAHGKEVIDIQLPEE